ncbi:endonuclease III [Treponema pallidum]|uniref:Endonuclease III n=4 Tax=Treponema pallidum TaxID=160 RepID=END3_TREPA|nr:endonuclease III [Treponema pallidum]O83754.1 RecName: Full=Endonuclease III; AltName: Full=DNA-(apurinic or apyrimidinic site) lyase [Treponema pallidum subsp. pallidum str. Nichols]AAC65744.1 endonuclease III (nth) [Treponema pallidum subsp. pallidum str. Nichols]ACD71193.1 endonuclease III [Treponema pallidum subsp. pallidum SS14]ADD72871.1 endonuclease III [Treponema pallidum subsp. pallidum str. Chicago]AEZ57903.1 DNA-(apurinic or apyrimidinic site) lyase [Treponema pallidum subsp. per
MRLLDSKGVHAVFEQLHAANPQPQGELHWRNTFTLLVAVLLSAQATDKSVNKATAALFDVADTPQAMLALGEERLCSYIRTINLYPTKARRIIALSAELIERFAAQVPCDAHALESLPGVGHKTANVVLNMGFGIPTIAVDTHILRTAPRIGLSSGRTPRAVERDLLVVTPREFRMHAHHWILLHGRYTCTARRPRCTECCLRDLCCKNNI